MRPGDVLGPLQLEAIREVVRQELAELGTAPLVEGYIGTAEAARRAGVTQETVTAWIAKGILAAVKVPGTKGWKIRAGDLAAVMESRGTQPDSAIDFTAARGRRIAGSITTPPPKKGA